MLSLVDAKKTLHERVISRIQNDQKLNDETPSMDLIIYEEIEEAVKNASKLAIIDKNVCFGVGGALFNDIKARVNKEAYDFITGLGGRDITPETILEIVEQTKNPVKDVNWIDLKEDY